MFPLVPWTDFLLTSVGLYLIIIIRYFFIAGLFYWLLWVRPTKYPKLQDTTPSKKTILNEIKFSVITSILFTIPGAYMIEAWKHGGTLIYSDLYQYPLWYIPLSIFIYMFLHDTYFYWTHKWMHHPKLFNIFHKVHHNSPNPTPWAAFSFHPNEGFIEAIIVPLLVFILPVHIGVLLFILTAMTFFSVVNHCGYEIYPRFLMKGLWGQWMITPSHHNIHHKKYKCNYGLYFRFWDRWLGTDENF